MKILSTRCFKWWEIGLIKVCLISLGILLGIYFNNVLVNLTLLLWVLFVVIAIYFIARFILEKSD